VKFLLLAVLPYVVLVVALIVCAIVGLAIVLRAQPENLIDLREKKRREGNP